MKIDQHAISASLCVFLEKFHQQKTMSCDQFIMASVILDGRPRINTCVREVKSFPTSSIVRVNVCEEI